LGGGGNAPKTLKKLEERRKAIYNEDRFVAMKRKFGVYYE